ncbi:hypothetical protein K4G90_23445, partial [Mycobacterium tuberculosis]|nr:hypothetical protein [Mycobacterium tuberculosis]
TITSINIKIYDESSRKSSHRYFIESVIFQILSFFVTDVHFTRYRPSLFTHRALVLQADFEYRKPAGIAG